jgi:4-hydroxybenzoate polyprenyltransferase
MPERLSMSTQTDNAEAARAGEVLFVDLDGSLIATDLLWEQLFSLLKRRPWLALLVPFWALRGRAALKGRVAQEEGVRPEALPYNAELLEVIRDRRARGEPAVLATASPRAWAEPIAEHLGCFDAVLATEPSRNLKSARKLEAIRDWCRQRGLARFDYVGDAGADLAIWREAAAAYIVAPAPALARRVRALGPGRAVHQVGRSRRPLRSAFRAVRPHQWAKNALIFVPLVTGQALGSAPPLLAASAAFAAFSLCASAIYLVNDLFDLESDRAHPEKRRRPFASGELPLSWGPPMVAGLLVAAFGAAAALLPATFLVVLASYLTLTTLYSLAIKSRLMVDVLALAGLYSLRIFAGGVAAGIAISGWLIGFSTFFFLSLAFAKRYIELDRAIEAGRLEKLEGRGYWPSDIGMIETLGATSGYLSVLVLALYIQDEHVQRLYRNSPMLWLIALALIYWISRVWFLAKRRQLPGDPVVFALQDWRSLVVGVLVAAVLAAAALLPPLHIGP